MLGLGAVGYNWEANRESHSAVIIGSLCSARRMSRFWLGGCNRGGGAGRICTLVLLLGVK